MFVGKRDGAGALPVPRDALDVPFRHIGHDWRDERVFELAGDPLGRLGYDEFVLTEDHMWAVLLGSGCSDDDRGRPGINLVRYLHPGQFVKENSVGYLRVSDRHVEEQGPQEGCGEGNDVAHDDSPAWFYD